MGREVANKIVINDNSLHVYFLQLIDDKPTFVTIENLQTH